MGLTSQGLAAVDVAFLEGTPEFLPSDDNYATPIAGHAPIDLGRLHLPEPGMPLGAEDDPVIALALHRGLDIERGVATDTRMWAWLAACHLPQLLRSRWATGERAPKQARFIGRLVDHGLARLWWAAELTCTESQAPREHREALGALLMSQYRTDRLLGMSIARHPPVLLGFLDALGDDIRWQVLNQVCQRLGVMATTYAVVAMTRDETRSLVSVVYSKVLAEREFLEDTEPVD